MNYQNLALSLYEQARRLAPKVASEAAELGLQSVAEQLQALPEAATIADARFGLCDLRGAYSLLFSKRTPAGASRDDTLDRMALLTDIVDKLYFLSRLG